MWPFFRFKASRRDEASDGGQQHHLEAVDQAAACLGVFEKQGHHRPARLFPGAR